MGREGVPVRKASAADAEIVGRMLFDFNTEFDTPTPSVHELTTRFVRLLRRTDLTVLISDGSADVSGFAYLTFRPTPYADGPLAQLEELYVRPGLRGRGIGTALIDAAKLEAQRRGCAEMDINVDEPDLDARRFYELHGFRNTEPWSDWRMLCYVQEL